MHHELATRPAHGMVARRARAGLGWKMAGLALAMSLAACGESAPTATDDPSLLINKNRPGAPMVLPATGRLADGGTFTGQVTVQRFDVTEARELVVSGVVNGTATTADGVAHAISNQRFSVVSTLTEGHALEAISQLAARKCQILFLDLGPIFLDLLGLQLDISRITIDLSAVTGPGNLLGNLLCAVVSLLDGPAAIAAILNLIDRINMLLGSLP